MSVLVSFAIEMIDCATTLRFRDVSRAILCLNSLQAVSAFPERILELSFKLLNSILKKNLLKWILKQVRYLIKTEIMLKFLIYDEKIIEE